MTENHDLYRIRWSIVDDGYNRSRRMCLAERRAKVLFWDFWWPTANGNWRLVEADAARDIAVDRELRATLPPTKVVL